MVEKSEDGGSPVDVTDLLVNFSRKIEMAFDQDRTQSNEDARERYSAALNVVANFVTNVVGHKYGEHFFELGSALVDLNDGTVSDLLEPTYTGTRPPDPSKLWRARAYVAIALHALISGGQKPEEAAYNLFREFPDIAKLANKNSRSGDIKKTILAWRKLFSAGRISNIEAGELYDVGRELIESKTIQMADLGKFAHSRVRAALR